MSPRKPLKQLGVRSSLDTSHLYTTFAWYCTHIWDSTLQSWLINTFNCSQWVHHCTPFILFAILSLFSIFFNGKKNKKKNNNSWMGLSFILTVFLKLRFYYLNPWIFCSASLKITKQCLCVNSTWKKSHIVVSKIAYRLIYAYIIILNCQELS